MFKQSKLQEVKFVSCVMSDGKSIYLRPLAGQGGRNTGRAFFLTTEGGTTEGGLEGRCAYSSDPDVRATNHFDNL